jgi:hypothetical protein
MDQRSIVQFLAIKRLSARAIHDKLVAVLGPDAIASSTVIKYLRHCHMFPIPIENLEEAIRTVIDDAILNALQQ